MSFPPGRIVRSLRPSASLSAVLLAALAICLLPKGTARAQSIPGFDRFPSDAPGRLAHAVLERLEAVRGGSVATPRFTTSSPELVLPEQRRSLWESIEGALGSHPLAGAAAAATSPRPAPLIDVLDSVIGAYMTELGHIALEIDQHGGRDAVTRLAPLHPGEQGTGSIEVGDVGAFHQLFVNFRGEIAHPDGRSPAVVAVFYLLPGRVGPPVAGRLVIPTAGAEPSFRAEVAAANGARETRDFGWRPRLSRLGSILELHINGQWTRVEDEIDTPLPRRRPAHEPAGFCDAACTGAQR